VAKASAKMDNAIHNNKEEDEKKWWPLAVATCFFFYGFVIFHFAQLGNAGMWSVAWVMYVTYVGIVTAVRLKARDTLGINQGNIFEDFFAALIFYPNVALQLEETIEVMVSKEKLGPHKAKGGPLDLEGANVNHAFENGSEKVPPAEG